MKEKWAKRNIFKLLVVFIIMTAIIMPIFETVPVHAVARTLYWVVSGGTGTGNISDANHWDEHPNGLGGDAPPVLGDSINFGALSFNGAGQVVTVDASTNILNMDWTNATNSPTFTINNTLSVYGSITFISAMTLTATSGSIIIKGDSPSSTLTSNGLVWHCNGLTFSSTFTGTLTLQDNLDMTGKNITHIAGTINTNGKTVIVATVVETGATARTLTLGNSVINCTTWDYSGSGLTLTPNTSTIKVTGTGAFTGGSLITYNNVELNGTAHTISGSNTFVKLSFKPAAGQTITFTDTTTQTAASFERTGTGQIVFQGSAAAGWALTDNNGGTNTFNALTVSRSTAGGATFNATTSSLNSGNNVGWTFPSTITTQAVSAVAKTTATGNGTSIDQGGAAISARGVCWNTTGLPTTADSKATAAGTLGAYTVAITGLNPTYTYYARAYFTNADGTTYGNEVNFAPNFLNTSSNFGWMMVPISFIVLGLLLVLSFNFEALGTEGIKNLVYIAIVIFLLFAFLVSMQPGLNALP